MNSSNYILSFYALVNILLGLYNLRNRNRLQQLLTAVSGLHFTFVMFFGLGFLSYANYDIQNDTIGRDEILKQLEKLAPYLAIGYFCVSFFEYRKFKWQNKGRNFKNTHLNLTGYISNSFCAFFLALAYIGLVFSQLSFAGSGVGTFFPVFNNFIYPITILIIVKTEKKNPFSIVLLILLFLLVGVDAIFSSWRSQLIMFSISILIGLNIRGKVNYLILSVIGIVYCFYVLPFQQLKKFNLSEYGNSPIEAFKASMNYDFEKRMEVFAQFLAERINYTREMAYVQSALDKGRLEEREGESYIEVLYQLIPRVFWEEKPSYAQYTGYQIPRKIELLHWEDFNTSWAVNSFAEFLYNFTFPFLPFFTVVLYAVLSFFDRLTLKLKLYPEFTWFLQATLFFLSLNLLSVIYSSTYFVWTFIIIIFFNQIKKNRNADTAVRRN